MNINLKWDITYQCNLNCSHCVNGDFLGDIEEEIGIDDIKTIIFKMQEAEIGYVHLLGGEPTARADIIEIFEEFSRYNISFGFNTNGLKLSNSDFREVLITNKSLKNIVFSLEGPNKEINDSIRGKRVFETTTRNIREIINLKKQYKRSDVKITVNTVVSRINLEDIVDMIYFCINLGVDEIVLLQFIKEGNGKKLEVTLDIYQEIELIKKIAYHYKNVKEKINIVPRFTFPLAGKYAKEVLHLEFPPIYHMCGAGEKYFYLNNKGELFPCDRYKERIKSLHNVDKIKLAHNNFWDVASLNGFEEIFQRSEDKDSYALCEPCVKCEYLMNKCYPCSAQTANNKITMKTCSKLMEEINVQSK